MIDRSTLSLLAVLLTGLIAVPVHAQGLPAWAEPSEPSELRVHEQDLQRDRRAEEVTASRKRPLGRQYRTEPLGPVTNDRRDWGACWDAPGSFSECVACNWSNECDAYCQTNPNTNVCENYTPPNEVPVDDYLPLLALAGIAFGVIRLRS